MLQRKPDGPCSWAVRRFLHFVTIRNATKNPCPLLVGQGFGRSPAAALAGGTAALVGAD